MQDAIYALKRFRKVAMDEVLDLDQLDGSVRIAGDDILALLEAAHRRLDLVASLHGIVQDLRAQEAGLCVFAVEASAAGLMRVGHAAVSARWR